MKPVDQQADKNVIELPQSKSLLNVQSFQKFRVAAQLLLDFLRERDSIDTSNSPTQKFAKDQVILCCLRVLHDLRKTRLEATTWRQEIENLHGLLRSFELKDRCAFGLLSRELARFILQLSDILTMAERRMLSETTNWTAVAQMIESRFVEIPFDIFNPSSLLQKLQLGSLLGAGGVGLIYKASIGEISFAVKFIPRNFVKSLKKTTGDKQLAALTHHALIVRFYASFVTMGAFVLCMEDVQGVDLVKVNRQIGSLPEQVIRCIIAQLCASLFYLHSKGFMHRDVKLSNILVTKGCRLKLLDFDTVKVCMGRFIPRKLPVCNRIVKKEFPYEGKIGTMMYRPPECFSKQSGYGRTVDWWATGVSTFILATGKIPYHAKTSAVYIESLKKERNPWPKDKQNSESVKNLVDQFLRINPKERLGSSGYEEIRNHPFFKGIDWTAADSGELTEEFDQLEKFMTERLSKSPAPLDQNAIQERKLKWFPEDNLLVEEEKQTAIFSFCSTKFRQAIAEVLGAEDVQSFLSDQEVVDTLLPELDDEVYSFQNHVSKCSSPLPAN